MRNFLGVAIFLFLGFSLQVLVVSLMPSPYFCPHFVLLSILACGLFRGPLLAESLGFLCGLALDAVSTTTFGTQGLLLAWAGYLGGLANHWVNAEESISQLILAFSGTLFYFFGLYGLQNALSGVERSLSWGVILSQTIVNVLVAPIVFSGVQWWGRRWAMSSMGES